MLAILLLRASASAARDRAYDGSPLAGGSLSAPHVLDSLRPDYHALVSLDRRVPRAGATPRCPVPGDEFTSTWTDATGGVSSVEGIDKLARLAS